MAPRTLHQAMAYLGLAEQTEPVRDSRRSNDDYPHDYADVYDDTRGVAYDFDDDDRYDGYPEEDTFGDDVEHLPSEPQSGSVREDVLDFHEEKSQQRSVREVSEPAPRAAVRQQSAGPASTGPLHVVTSAENKPASRAVNTKTTAVNDESEDELRRITTIHPRSYNDAKIIGESFRESIPVIMNVTDMGESEAKRLVDFSAGLAFALHGSIERVTDKVFLLTPANLEVLGAEGAEVPVALDSEPSHLFDQD